MTNLMEGIVIGLSFVDKTDINIDFWALSILEIDSVDRNLVLAPEISVLNWRKSPKILYTITGPWAHGL